jgi:asparagine synthase (glutamine-hydrolysing)
MCDVSGFTGNLPFSIEQFGEVNKARGPDGTTYYDEPFLKIAHSLLAISPNKEKLQQPYTDERTGNVLAWVGELYGLGKDQFDTKVLSDILALGEVGIEMLKYNTNGMWGFVYYNRAKQTITMCRDHWGVKPLYYATMGENLAFSSTPIPLIMALNTLGYGSGVNNFRKHQWEQNDRFLFGTGFPINGIKKVPPGGIVTWCMKRNKITKHDNLWGNFKLEPNYSWSSQEIEEKITKCITEVCTAPGIKKTVALSGGIDSTLIASVAKRNGIEDLTATTIKFLKKDAKDPKGDFPVNMGMYEEFNLAKQTCAELDIPHKTSVYHGTHECFTTTMEMLQVPMWDRKRTAPRHENIKTAAKNKNKIYIVGDGADELVTGYSGDYNYFADGITHELDQMKWHHRVREIKDMEKKRKTLMGTLSSMAEVFQMVPQHKDVIGVDGVNNRQWMRGMIHIDGFMTAADHLCGAYGMESRAPYLHQELSKFLLNIPGAVKLQMPACEMEEYPEDKDAYLGQYKWVLRDACKDLIPDHVRYRGKKIGFADPVNARDAEYNNFIGNEDFENYHQWVRQLKFDVDSEAES